MQIASTIYTYFLSLYLFFANENILQKQYYDIRRFLKAKKQFFTFSPVKFISFLLVLLSCIALQYNWLKIFFTILHLIALFLLYRIKFKKEIIPFHFTKRVKRALFCYTLVYGGYTFLVFALSFSNQWIPFIYFFSFPFFFIGSYFLSLLLEKYVLYHFQKKAKEKLKKMTHLKVIAISGSYGKTSLKHYLKQLLEGKYKVLASQKSYNTMQGLLKTINEDLQPFHEVLILEMGVDKPNGMKKFLRFFPIDIAILTCVGKQHLSTFKTFENIKKEKLRLLQHLHQNQVAILNIDDETIQKCQAQLDCQTITISSLKNADVYAENIKVRFNSTHFELVLSNQRYSVKTSVLGRHHVNNILLAIATAQYLKVNEEQILKRLRLLKNVEHRMEIKKDHLWDIIDDAYNSNYKGFLEALNVLKKSPNKKVLITPGLIELNAENANIQQNLAKYIKSAAQLVLITNENGNIIEESLLNINYNPQNILKFSNYLEAMQYLKNNFFDQKLTILIENDLPDIYLK